MIVGLITILRMTISIVNRFHRDFKDIQGSKKDTIESAYKLPSSNVCCFSMTFDALAVISYGPRNSALHKDLVHKCQTLGRCEGGGGPRYGVQLEEIWLDK